MSDEPMYSVREASIMLGLSPQMVRYYTRKGALKCQRIIGGSAIIYTKEHLDVFLADLSGLSTVEVAAMCGVTPAVVASWVHRSMLPVRMSVINELRFDEADVRKFATERGIQLHALEERKSA